MLVNFSGEPYAWKLALTVQERDADFIVSKFYHSLNIYVIIYLRRKIYYYNQIKE